MCWGKRWNILSSSPMVLAAAMCCPCSFALVHEGRSSSVAQHAWRSLVILLRVSYRARPRAQLFEHFQHHWPWVTRYWSRNTHHQMVLVAELCLAVHTEVEIQAVQTLVAIADDSFVAHIADGVRVLRKILPVYNSNCIVHQRRRLLAYDVKTGLCVGHRPQKNAVVAVRGNTDLVLIVIYGEKRDGESEWWEKDSLKFSKG